MGKEKMEEIEKATKSWEAGLPKQQKEIATSSGIAVKPLYNPVDLKDWDYLEKLGFPGVYPFVRGRDPLGHRENIWLVSEYCGFADAEASNKYLKYLINEGCQNMHIALDLPTQNGYDSDSPRARGEVGKIGVTVNSLQDVEALFKGIPLDKVTTGSPVTCIAPVWLAFLLAIMEKQQKPPQKLRAITANDCLMDYYARGTAIFPPKWGLKFSNDVTEYCAKNGLVGVETLSVAGYHAREAGLNACQEVALVLAQAAGYIEDLLKRGMSIDSFASHFNVFIALTEDLFEEVAKLRALRRLWAKMMKEKFGAKEKESQALDIRGYTSGAHLTRQQPLNNIIRVTIEALAGVLGGVQKLYCSSYDEALAIPSEESVRVALRTQQILAHETGVTNSVDPLGGSYYLEHLTDAVEKGAVDYFETIQKIGGILAAIEGGWLARELARAAYESQKQLESGEKIKVGVNKYCIEEPESLPIKEVESEVEQRQIEKVKKLRRERDNSKVETSLHRLKEAARQNVNLVPPLLDTVKTYATVGEIFDALREVWGEWRGLR